jgi:hypothetical protein
MPGNATYYTSDFTEICFLMAQGVQIVRTSRDGDRITFIFDDSNGVCRALMDDFLLGRDQVSASRLLTERAKALKIIRAS